MRIIVRATTAIFCLLLLSCTVFYPVAKVPDQNCELWSRGLILEKEVTNPGRLQCSDEACLAVFLAAVVIVPASTFIVSGSIVLVGNSIHWLERQGTCDDSYLKQKIREFKHLINSEADQT